jgi:HrpA-like RNA helicase
MLAGLLGQHRLQERRRGVVPRRARHQVLAPPGGAPVEEAGGAGSSPPSSWTRRACTAAASRRSTRNGFPGIAGHLLKKQLLEPHWEKKAAEVVALERATLYGIVVYQNRRVNFGQVDPAAAREIFIREALVLGEWETKLPFLSHNRRMVAQVEDLEHKSRRQDVLVDDELIHAFYDHQLPADVVSGASFERWYRDGVARQPPLLMLTRDELMRHEAAGITTARFPKTVRLGGVDCARSTCTSRRSQGRPHRSPCRSTR